MADVQGNLGMWSQGRQFETRRSSVKRGEMRRGALKVRKRGNNLPVDNLSGGNRLLESFA